MSGLGIYGKAEPKLSRMPCYVLLCVAGRLSHVYLMYPSQSMQFGTIETDQNFLLFYTRAHTIS